MKRVLISVLSIFIVTYAFAQQQKANERFGATVEDRFVGDYTYQFIKQENGKDVKVGPFEMKATINEKYNNYKTFWELKVTGKYNLKGNYSKGNLHGTMTMNANLLKSATNGDKANYTSSFSGNFKNGIPDGNFNVNHLGNKVNVNYKNGVLVGAYYVKGWDSNSLPFTTSGTLNANGKPTGVWKFENVQNKKEVTFSNGVVVNRPDYDANLRTKAKSYASGAISKEKLLKENICVRMDSLMLGYDAWVHILHNGIDWEKIGGYDFSKCNSVKYYYLDRLPTLSSVGFDIFKKGVLQYIKEGGDMQDLSNDNVSKETKLMLESYSKSQNLCYDAGCGLSFILIHKRDNLSEFCIGYPDWSNYIEEIYLLPKQLEELQKLLHEARLENLDKIPITDLDYRVSEGYEYQIKEDFIPCDFDQNIVVFECVNHRPRSIQNNEKVLYFSRDTFEDYFIQMGYGSTILRCSPENRHEVINKKIENYKITFAENWFMENIINKDYNSLASSSATQYIVGEDASLFPILSYSTICATDSGVSARVNVGNTPAPSLKSIFSSKEPKQNGYRTYEITVYVKDNNITPQTFTKQNFVKIKNDYDVIAEIDALIEENNEKIKTFSKTTFKSNYSEYTNYKDGLNMTINHDDLKATIDERNNIVSVQTKVFEFIEKLSAIQNSDNDIAEKCADKKDVLKSYLAYTKTRDLTWTPNWSLEKLEEYTTVQRKCMEFIEKLSTIQNYDNDIATKCADKKDILKSYLAYTQTRDLAWSPNWSLEKLEEYTTVQKKCIEFIELRNTVMNNNLKIKNLKSAAPNIYKAYINYSKMCDVSWKADVNFETINSLIDIQEKYITAISKQDISKIDKNVKKQKMTDIVKILDLEELK